MTSFKRTQRKYVQKAYRVRNWREYETGLRARGSLTVWLGLTDGKLANWNSPRPTRRKPGRQRQYSNHAIETTVTLGLVFGLASRQTEGFLRSLLTLLNLDNDVPDHSTISRRKARLGKVASYERRTVKPVHLRIDSSGLSVHVGQLRTPPKARDYRKLHLAVDEQTSDVVACELTSKRARDASRVASLVGQIERPIASAKADAAYDTGDVYKTLENHRAHRSPKVLIPPRKGAQLALDSAGTRQRNRNIRARSHVGKRKWYVASGYSRRSKVETTFHRYKAILGSAMRARGLAFQRVEVRLGCKILNTMTALGIPDGEMTGRRRHGRLSALNGVVHQGTSDTARAIRDEIGFFQAIRAALAKSTPGKDGRSPADRELAIQQIVSRAVVSTEIIDIMKAAGLESPDITILSDDFLAEIRDAEKKNLAIDALRKLINGEVRSQARRNVTQARSFTERLEAAILRYHNNALTTAQVLEELIQLARDISAARARGEETGLSDEEIAFYDALAENKSAREVMGEPALRVIAHELVSVIRNNVSVDWIHRDSARANIRRHVKRLLRKYGYPPDLQDAAVQNVLQQAEALSAEWTA